MPAPLVITESAAKSRALTSVIGQDFRFANTRGNLFQLEDGEAGLREGSARWVGVNPDVLADLVSAVKGRFLVYLATDCDDAGELIAYHAQQYLMAFAPHAKWRRVRLPTLSKAQWDRAMADPGHLDHVAIARSASKLIADRLITLRAKERTGSAHVGRVLSPTLAALDHDQDPLVGEIHDVRAAQNGQWAELRLPVRRSQVPAATDLEALLHAISKPLTLRHPAMMANPDAAPMRSADACLQAARLYRLTPNETMQMLGNLYLRGQISYPRTEGRRFSPAAVDAIKTLAKAAGASVTPGLLERLLGNEEGQHEALHALEEPAGWQDQSERASLLNMLHHRTVALASLGGLCEGCTSEETLADVIGPAATRMPAAWRSARWLWRNPATTPGVPPARGPNTELLFDLPAAVVLGAMMEHRIGSPASLGYNTERLGQYLDQQQRLTGAGRFALAAGQSAAPGLACVHGYAAIAHRAAAALQHGVLGDPISHGIIVGRLLADSALESGMVAQVQRTSGSTK